MSWILIPIALFVYLAYLSKVENERRKEVARIEAELKLKLVDRLKDPQLIKQVIEAKLPLPGEGETAAASAPPAPRRSLALSLCLFVGLICFLVGVALLIASFTSRVKELSVGGLICSGVGLAFLTFATSQQQIRRLLGDPTARASGP